MKLKFPEDIEPFYPLLVKEVEVDMDIFRKSYKPKIYASKVFVMRCPVCGEWRVIYRERIPYEFLRVEPEFTLVTAKLRASPRHSHALYKVHYYSAHSDNKFKGWAGDHIERVWAFFEGTKVRVARVFSFDDKEATVLAEDTRGQKLIVSEYPTDYTVIDGLPIVDYPHFSCVPNHIIERYKEPYEVQGNLRIYEIYKPEFPVSAMKCSFRFFNHFIDANGYFSKDYYEYPCGDNKAVFIELKDKANIYARDHETVTVEPGFYMLLHPVPTEEGVED